LSTEKKSGTVGPLNKTTLITIALIATITLGVGWLIYKPSTSGLPPKIDSIDNQFAKNETETVSELTNTSSPEPGISNITDTSAVSEDEPNATQPEIPEPDSSIAIIMNVSDLYDLYINASFRYYADAKAKIENLTGKVIGVRGTFRMSARKKAEDNETYELVILFGTDDESNPKDIFVYLPFTEEVLQAVSSVKYPDAVVVQGEFYPGPPEPLPFNPSVLYSIFGRLKNCQLVP